MTNRSNNINVPEARGAMDKFKQQAASADGKEHDYHTNSEEHHF